MALAQGDAVIPAGWGSTYPQGIPLAGIVESIGPVIVDWNNGKQTSYADAGANSLTQIEGAPANPVVEAFHKKVVINNPFADPPGAANGLGTSQGMVIGGFTVTTGLVDYVIVLWTSGDISPIALSAVTVLDT